MNVGGIFVLNGNFIFNFGGNGTIGLHEKFFPNGGVKAIAVSLVVRGSGIDTSDVAFMFEGGNFMFVGVANNAVDEEILPAAFVGGADDVSESWDGHKVSGKNSLSAFFCGVRFCNISDDAVGCGFDGDGVPFLVRVESFINHGNIGAAILVEVENFLEIDIVDVRAVDEEDVFFIGKFGEVEVGVNVLEVTLASVIGRESGGEVSQAVTPAGKIPIFTGADMVEDSAGIIREHKPDGVDAGINHIGK